MGYINSVAYVQQEIDNIKYKPGYGHTLMTTSTVLSHCPTFSTSSECFLRFSYFTIF